MTVELVLIGLAAGFIAGMLGVGGGVLFVPALVIVLHLTQVTAEATSLLAIIPVAFLGAWRQQRYGNVRIADAAPIGALSAAGVLAGVALANILSGRTLTVAFALLMLFIAAHLIRSTLRQKERRQ